MQIFYKMCDYCNLFRKRSFLDSVHIMIVKAIGKHHCTRKFKLCEYKEFSIHIITIAPSG